MSAGTWWGLAAVFLGGALPWLEAAAVIPAGIIAGLPATAVIIAGSVGNLITVAIAAFGGEWLREKWARWRTRRSETTGKVDAEAEARKAAKAQKRRERIQRIMNRGGLPLLAVLGPFGLGTQLSAVVAVASGVRAMTAFLWIGAATVVICVLAAVATLMGFEIIGIT